MGDKVDNLKRNKLEFSLNSISETNNPSQLEATFVVHDFLTSWNGAVISKEVAQENIQYLVGQYICCKYIPKENNDGLDALGDHEAGFEINRDTGSKMVSTNTVPIGHITEAYIDMGTQSDGTEGEVVYCKATLWLNKFYNVLSFLNEMVESGINVPCSVEYAYSNYEMKDGIRYDQSPIYYEALCILNPIDRGDIKQVLPAYDSSKFEGFSFNSLVEADIHNSKNESKEGVKTMENIFYKALNGLSLGDQRDKVMVALSKNLTAEEFNNTWISMYDIEADVVKYETCVDGEWKKFAIPYSITEGQEIELNMAEKAEWEYQAVIKEVIKEVPVVDEEATKAFNSKIEELEGNLLSEKDSVVSLNAQIVSLTEEVAKLEAYKTQLEEIEHNAKVEAVQAEYKAKFEVFNSVDKFESEEVQALVLETLDEEKSMNAKLAIADILVEVASSQVTVPVTEETTPVVELCNKKTKPLVPSHKTGAEYCGINLD